MKKTKDLSRLQVAELTCRLPKSPGTYLLFFELDRRTCLRIGKLSEGCFDPGYYAYVGSAFGPGGLLSRLRHHLSISERCHWHLDYIRPSLRFVRLWLTEDAEPCEHHWAALLANWHDSSIPIRQMGATDCRCLSHFFAMRSLPTVDEFTHQLRQQGLAGSDIQVIER